jgi:hypothetical protein
VDGCEVYNNGNTFTQTGNEEFGMQIFNGYTGESTNNNIVRNNRFHDNGAGTQGGAMVIGSGNNTEVYNNLVYGNFRGITICCGTTIATNEQILNNTVSNNTNEGVNAQDGTGHLVQNNIFYANGVNEVYNAATTHSYNLTTDPRFVNTAGGDFRLQANSSAIDAGATLSQVTIDIISTPRPQGAAYDIGAYEFPTNNTPPSPPTNVTIIN